MAFLQSLLPTQGLNLHLPCLLHCRLILYLPSHPVTLSLFPTELRFSRKLSDYGVTVPCSTDSQGRFLSHVVSGPAAASAGSMKGDGPPSPLSHSSRLRVARSPLRPEGMTLQPGRVGRSSLYFNVTVFGEELHLHLRPNRRLVVPGASVEWQEDFQELFRQPLQRECVYTGGVTGMPGAAVAISNCDGLVRDKPLIKFHSPILSFTSHCPPCPPPMSQTNVVFSLAPMCLGFLWARPEVWAKSGAALLSKRTRHAPLATRLTLCWL